MTRYRLESPNELGAGARLGGIRNGPTNGERIPIWNGRPPQQDDIWGPRILALTCRPVLDAPDASPNRAALPAVRTVEIEVEASDAWGAKIRRVFVIGEGLSADLYVGSYKLVKATIISAIPAGMNLYFSWTGAPSGSYSGDQLISYVAYPNAGQRIALPEGTAQVAFDKAGNVTWEIDLPGAIGTFTQPVLAGQSVRALWGTMSFNQANTNIIAQLRPF